jgi:hypothetical protein
MGKAITKKRDIQWFTGSLDLGDNIPPLATPVIQSGEKSKPRQILPGFDSYFARERPKL